MGVRDGPEAGLPEVGSLGGDHRLESGSVAMGLKAERLNLNNPEAGGIYRPLFHT